MIIAEAKKTQSAADLAKWTPIQDSFHSDIMESFLLLRVTAVYLIGKEDETRKQGYLEQMKKMKLAVNHWKDAVASEAAMEPIVKQILENIADYEAAGQKYLAGIKMQDDANIKMASSAKEIVGNFNTFQGDVKQAMDTLSARTNISPRLLSRLRSSPLSRVPAASRLSSATLSGMGGFPVSAASRISGMSLWALRIADTPSRKTNS